MDNWDDLRFLLAIARTGSTRGAARQLGVNQSTVSRRLAQLEGDAGVRLFHRGPGGLEVTDAGQDAVEIATSVEAGVERLDRQVLGRDTRLSGPLRVTMPDFMVGPLGPILADFGRAWPEVALEVVVENGYVSLTRRQADVALRLTRQPDEQLVGRRIADVAVAVYAAEGLLDRVVDHAHLATLDWVRWEEAWRGIPPERWMDRHVAPERTRARVNTNLAMVELVVSGLGVAFQLCGTADGDPRLRRVSEPFPFGLSLWVLTHADLRATARIRTFMGAVADGLGERRREWEAASPR